jgi:hypothetical protein
MRSMRIQVSRSVSRNGITGFRRVKRGSFPPGETFISIQMCFPNLSEERDGLPHPMGPRKYSANRKPGIIFVSFAGHPRQPAPKLKIYRNLGKTKFRLVTSYKTFLRTLRQNPYAPQLKSTVFQSIVY